MTLSPDRIKFIGEIANDEWAHDLRTTDSGDEKEFNEEEFEKQASIWEKIRIEFLETSDSAEELHEFVKQHHWGEVDDFLILIENPECDRNTARLIFWLIGVEHYRRHFATREDCQYSDEKMNWDLIHRITEKMADGKFSKERMPDDYEQYIPPKNEYWEIEPHWEIIPLMYGSDNT